MNPYDPGVPLRLGSFLIKRSHAFVPTLFVLHIVVLCFEGG